MKVATFRRAATARKAGNTITSENGDKVLRNSQGAKLARIPKKQPGGRVVLI